MATAKKTGANVTLLRGRNYTLIHPFQRRLGSYQFKKGEPRVVMDPDVVEYCRGLTETVTDSDGQEIAKPRFRITPLDAENVTSTRRSAAADDEEDAAPRRRTAGPTRRGRRV